MSCSGTDIFGDDTCEGAGLTPQQEQDLDDVVEKTQLQSFVAPGTTNFNGKLTLNGVPLGSGGGGDVSGPATSADNGVCFYSGVSGKIIKEVATIKYNPIPNSLAVPDLSTTVTTSLNTDLQKISNITSAVQLPTPITVLDGELDVKVIKSFEKNVELEFDDDNAILTATDITLNGAVTSNGAITLENQTTPNTLLLASFATGDNRIDSSGDLEINGSNLTMNLTGGNLTENVGLNKISLISGNLTENIAANKVTTITAAHISTASSHTFNGALTSSTSVTTPLINGISTITNGSDININNIGGNLIISNDEVIINSNGGIDLTGAAFGISLGANQITTTKTTFIDTELVTKKYVDDSIPAGSPYELIFAVTDQISNITTTGQKFQIRAPRAFTISKFKLSLNSTAGVNFSVTLFKNSVSFSSVFLPSLVQDTSFTETFAENDIISVNISNIGAGTASGLIVYLLE